MWCYRNQRQGPRGLFLYGYLIFFVSMLPFLISGSYFESTTSESIELGEKIMQMLRSIEKKQTPLTANLRFSLTLGQFLIKEKVRFYEATRYEAQTYFHIQKKLQALLSRPIHNELTTTQKQILDNIFHKNILLIRPSLKEQCINVEIEYETLTFDYENLIDQGMPNATLSDDCLAAIVTLDVQKCRLREDCHNTILKDISSYGYQRLHQILLLYVFMHHECSIMYAPREEFEVLAGKHCTQVYREQLVIKEHQLPLAYRDLYLEQNVICGLFGFVEFLNWHNMELLSNVYAQIDGCYCTPHVSSSHDSANQKINEDNCNCNNHINSLALVYYINGFLLLE